MSLSPIDIMELQANKRPGYLMIQKESAKERATKLLLYYGKGRSLDSMKRLVDDMSDYYRTTKVMMKTRLIEMGFTELSGLTQTANGHLIPPYVSTLGKEKPIPLMNQTQSESLWRMKNSAELSAADTLYMQKDIFA